MSPIVHSGTGLFAWQYAAEKKNIKTFILFLLISNMPDIDFLFFIFLGKHAFSIHQFYTHNVFFVTGMILLFIPLLTGSKERLVFILTAYSHLFLDLLTRDGSVPYGFRLFYPFWDQRFHMGIFPNLHKSSPADIFSFHNVWVLSLETLIFVVPVVVYYRKEFKGYWKQFFQGARG